MSRIFTGSPMSSTSTSPPLLSDVGGEVNKAYGSWLTGRSLRHTYLIDPNGILRERFLGVRPAIHSQEVLLTLESLLMPANNRTS